MALAQRPASVGFDRRRGALSILGSLVGLAAATAAVLTTLYAVDPNQPGHYPTCPFLALTGWYCPGCGALRAVHDLLHLDLAGALARNPLTVLAVPYLVLAAVTWALRLTGRPAPRSTALPAWVLWTLLGVVLLFGVLRNLPGWTWLSPA